MILRGADASRYFAKPDPSRAGLLIFGADPMRVALKRAEVITALIGPDGAGEMRLTRISAADLRKDPALLMDALKSQGFFPGPRAALLEDAADALAPLVEATLKDWRPGDAHLIVTAGGLTGKSTLKKLFETRPDVYSAGLYDDPPTREEIEASLKKAGLTAIDRDAMADLTTLARAIDPGDFRQTLEKIALYKWGDATPLTPAEVAMLAPATIERWPTGAMPPSPPCCAGWKARVSPPWACASARSDISAPCIPHPPIRAAPPPASPARAPQCLVPAVISCCGKPPAGG